MSEDNERRNVEAANVGGQLEPGDPIPIPINSTTIPQPESISKPVSEPVTPTSTPKQKRIRAKSISPPSPTPKPTRAARKPKPTPPWLSTPPEVLARKIESYHKDAERRCLADYANDTHDKDYYCPCLPTEFRKYYWGSVYNNWRILSGVLPSGQITQK